MGRTGMHAAIGKRRNRQRFWRDAKEGFFIHFFIPHPPSPGVSESITAKYNNKKKDSGREVKLNRFGFAGIASVV